MKKTISILMIICLLVSVFCVQALAEETTKRKYLYEERFVEYLDQQGVQPSYPEEEDWYRYSEYYKYFSDQNDTDVPDWLLIRGASKWEADMLCYAVVGDYIIKKNSMCYPSALGYFIYIPKSDAFYPLTEAWNMDIVGIENAIIYLAESNPNMKLVGDADMDNEITIMDATKIQRCLAELDLFDSKDVRLSDYFCATYEKIGYISDFDRDGERTIMDATAIQRKLAKII